MKNTELPARRTARAPGREREVKARLLGSLVLGAIAAATVVIYDDTANHAALVRGGSPQPSDGRIQPGVRVRWPHPVRGRRRVRGWHGGGGPPQGAAGCRATRVAGRRGAAAPWPRGFVAVTAHGDHRT